MNSAIHDFLIRICTMNTKVLLLLCFIYHLAFFFFNNVINKDQMVDSIVFYEVAMKVSSINDWFLNLRLGASFFIFLITPMVKMTGSFLFVSLMLSLVSFIPYYYVIVNRNKFISYNSSFAIITFFFFLFFPSTHVWTTTICKEAVLFPLMFFVLLWTYLHSQNVFLETLFIAIVVAIRPHLGIFLVFSVLLFGWKKLNYKLKIGYILGVILAGTLATYFVSQGFTNLNVFKMLAYLEVYSYGGTYMDLDENSYFYRMFSLLFRPLVWESKSILQLFYSIENVFFFIWIAVFLYLSITKKILKKVSSNIFIVNSILLILFISIYIFNLGLASRMKVMFMPFLLFGALLLINQLKNAKTS